MRPRGSHQFNYFLLPPSPSSFLPRARKGVVAESAIIPFVCSLAERPGSRARLSSRRCLCGYEPALAHASTSADTSLICVYSRGFTTRCSVNRVGCTSAAVRTGDCRGGVKCCTCMSAATCTSGDSQTSPRGDYPPLARFASSVLHCIVLPRGPKGPGDRKTFPLSGWFFASA